MTPDASPLLSKNARMKRLAALAFLFVCAAASAGAAETPMGFQDVLRAADRGNSDLEAGRRRHEQALERVLQARSYFFPELTAGASADRRTVNPETFGAPVFGPSGSGSSVVGPFNVYDARLRVTQTLFDLGMVRRFQAASAGAKLSAAETAKVREDVLALAGTLYFQARRAAARVEYARENLRWAAMSERVWRRRLELGTASPVDAQNARALLADARYAWRSAREARAAALTDLKDALGLPSASVLELHDEAIAAALPKPADVARDSASHPAVESLRALEAEEKALEEAEKASYLPSVQAGADYGANGVDVDDTEETYSFGARVSWSIFDLGRKPARVAEAAARTREAHARLEGELRESEAKIYEAKSQVKSAKNYLASRAQQRIYAETVLKTVETDLRTGAASRLASISASAALARARDAEEEARSLYRLAQMNLFHAQGKMKDFLETKK